MQIIIGMEKSDKKTTIAIRAELVEAIFALSFSQAALFHPQPVQKVAPALKAFPQLGQKEGTEKSWGLEAGPGFFLDMKNHS